MDFRNLSLRIIFAFALLTVVSAHAGDGQIDPANGDTDFSVHFTFPPTQQQIDDIKLALQQLSLGICDATDGQIRVRRVRLTQSQSDADRADFWIQALPGRSGGSFRTDGSNLGRLGSHLNIFRGAIQLPDVWLHEWGHHAFGLGEQYNEQRRYGGSCGIGPGFDTGTIDEQNHSIMQQSGRMQCVGGANNNSRCFQATECPGGTCEFVLMSEMSVAANHDLIRGSGVCPAGSPISSIELDGNLSQNDVVQIFDSTSFSTADATASWRRDVEAIDSIGNLPAASIVLYATRSDVDEWIISATIDAGALGGTVGNLTLLEQWTLTFNPDGSLASVIEVNPSLTVTGLATGAADLNIAMDFGTPNPAATAGQGIDGLVMSASLTQVNETHDGQAQCNAADCAQRWNTGTMRWETTQQSLVNNFLSGWETVARNYPFVMLPGNLPVAAPAAGCSRAVNFVEDVTGADQVMLIMDRSYSMAWSSNPNRAEVCSNGFDDDGDGVSDEAECADSRIEFARAAARAFVDLQVDRGVDVGLLEFDDLNRQVLPVDPLTGASIANVRTAIDNLTPRGNTAIGDALDASQAEFMRVATAGRSQTAYLMTDGFNNTGVDPRGAADRLNDIGVRIHAIPAGSDVDRDELSDIAAKTAGQLYDAEDIPSMTGLFAELAARQHGTALVLPRIDFVIAKNPSEAMERDPSLRDIRDKITQSRTFRIPVERGAKRLTGFIAGRNQNMREWGVDMKLVSPTGQTFDSGSPQFHIDSHYLFIDVMAPEAGDWLLVASPSAPAAQHATALAFIDNPRPKFYADVRPRVVTAGNRAAVSASVSYLVDLDPESVKVDGFLIDPLGRRKFVTLDPDDTTGWSIEISGLTLNGIYRLDLQADVGPESRVMRGESIFSGPERAPVRVEPFRRFASTSFLVTGGRDLPCEGKDCDGDGIPDEAECRGLPKDIDKDGIPNVRDEDSDNDQIPDAVEGMNDRNNNNVPDMCEPGPKIAVEDRNPDIVELMDWQKKIIDALCTGPGSDRMLEELKTMPRMLNRAIVSKRPSRDQEARIRRLLDEISVRLQKLAELVSDGRAECRAAEELLGQTLELEERILQILE